MNAADAAKIKHLASLLDDEDEFIAVSAMSELLYMEEAGDLGDVLAELQESPSPLARKRAHQLQAAITIRRRRRNFAKLLTEHGDLAQGLIEVHLQWFDNDSLPGLEKIWQEFVEAASRVRCDSLGQISYFMRKRGMTAVPETTLQPENYCIGTIVENNYGSAAILAGIAWTLAEHFGVAAKLVRVLGEFGVLDGDGMLLLPGRDWQIMQLTRIDQCDFWDRASLLKFASAMLFSHAVNSDSFRYIQTIAQSLTGAPDGELPGTFPYPYCPAEDEEPEGAEGGELEEH